MTHIKICKEEGCTNASTTKGYCRLHYLRNWKQIKDGERRKAAKKLNRYIEHVIRKHPDRYVDIIKRDLRDPGFDDFIEEHFGGEEEDGNLLFSDEPSYEEEIENLIRQLKVEKGF